jgi:AcrR family transcriptional regulator
MTMKAGSTSGSVAVKPASRTPEALLRRVPRQERGHERVDKLLDAAAAVIAEVGVDAATTNAIAARADTSVGSLYQFFPNKTAIVEALAARYNVQLRQLNEKSIPAEAAFMPLPDLMERVITPVFNFYLENPAYRHVFHSLHRPDRPERSDGAATCQEAELHKAVVARTEAILAVRSPQTPQDVRHLQATVAVLSVHAMLSFAVEASVSMRERLVNEVKRLLVVYFRDVTTAQPPQMPSMWPEFGRL